MKLTDLDARFVQWGQGVMPKANSLAEAHGVLFQCPLCAQGKPVVDFEESPGRRGVRGAHYVLCWFVGKVADDVEPKPGRWNPIGTSLGDLTFVGPGAASVQLLGGCNWHGFVSNGNGT